MKIDIKSSEDFIRLAKEAIDQENLGMATVPSNQADPRNIPREGAELTSLAAMHFFSFFNKFFEIFYVERTIWNVITFHICFTSDFIWIRFLNPLIKHFF